MGRKLFLWLVVAPLAVILAIQLYFFVQIWWWVDHNPTETSFMKHQLSLLREKNPDAKLQFKWVPYNRISSNLKRAIIASEDSNFTVHDGVQAAVAAVSGLAMAGAVLNALNTRLDAAAIAFMLEQLMDKERIFEIYLNVVEWGNGVFGAEAASMHYYGVSAANLGASQAARLAVMLPRPRFYDKNPGSVYLARRTGLILRRMGSAELP